MGFRSAVPRLCCLRFNRDEGLEVSLAELSYDTLEDMSFHIMMVSFRHRANQVLELLRLCV